MAEKGVQTENDEATNVDERDLTQLPGVDEALEARLKAQGYATLWEVAYEDATLFALMAEVSPGVSEKIIATATTLLGLEEDEAE
jgi:hypothetical protein